MTKYRRAIERSWPMRNARLAVRREMFKMGLRFEDYSREDHNEAASALVATIGPEACKRIAPKGYAP